MKRKRKLKPLANPIELAMKGVQRLTHKEVTKVIDGLRQSAENMSKESWADLADACRLTEAFNELRLTTGDETAEIVVEAEQALIRIYYRAQSTQAWLTQEEDVAPLAWLISLHDAQLRATSRREYEQALTLVERKVQAALKGNASPTRTFLVGNLGRVCQH